MALALQEAAKGLGRTHPNPVVGAVVARGGRALAVGHHRKAGGPHAEIEALRKAGERARGADLYVTLEPCDHYGRTPPCTGAILQAGIRRVFVGNIDPNPLVSGRGVRRLRAAGVEVRTGVLREACEAANEMWFKFITRKLPWVVLKAAVTLDGKLAASSGDSRWVSGAGSRALAHRLRDELDAVLVGIGTALCDDPRLTARGPGQRDPVRVVVDSTARLPSVARILRQRSAAKTLVACTIAAPAERIAALQRAGAEIVRCRSRGGRVDIKDLLRRLAGRGLTSVLVEGGAAIHGSFLEGALWDELYLFVAPKLAGKNGPSWAGFDGAPRMSSALPVEVKSVERVGSDLLLWARPAGGGAVWKRGTVRSR